MKRKDLDGVLSKTSHLRILGATEYEDAYGNGHSSPFDFFWLIADIVENGVRIDKSQWLNQIKKAT